MERFSLYDLLGLLLPGVFFVYFANVIANLYGMQTQLSPNTDWDMGLGVVLCLALFMGALLYTINFYLVNKSKSYNKIFKMYKHVADLYLEMKSLHQIMNDLLNKRAIEWFGKSIYFSNNEHKSLDAENLKKTKMLQAEFYDRMYYELEYENKIDSPKTLQSFYYFFRQLVTAGLLLLIATGILYALSLLPLSALNQPCLCTIFWLSAGLFLMIILSALLAQWYRKRMVMKMYWAYFIYLSKTSNK